jgi:hypothetical protein
VTGPRGLIEAVVVYFSGGGTERASDEVPRESWLVICVRILPPVTAALVLRSVLDWDDSLLDWLKTVGLMLPLSIIWGAMLWLFCWRATKGHSSAG